MSGSRGVLNLWCEHVPFAVQKKQTNKRMRKKRKKKPHIRWLLSALFYLTKISLGCMASVVLLCSFCWLWPHQLCNIRSVVLSLISLARCLGLWFCFEENSSEEEADGQRWQISQILSGIQKMTAGSVGQGWSSPSHQSDRSMMNDFGLCRLSGEIFWPSFTRSVR